MKSGGVDSIKAHTLFYIILLITALFLPFDIVFAMPDEITQNPNNTYFVAGKWNAPTWAYTSNNEYANTFKQGSWQGYHDYDFDSVLPTDISISKVEVGLEFYSLPHESLRIRISVDSGSTWSGWSNSFTLASEDMLWIEVTAFKESWIRSYLLNENWRVEVEMLTEGGSGCFHPDTLITMAKKEDGDYEYEKIKGLKKGDKILGYKGKQQIVTKYEEHKDSDATLFYNITMVDNRSLIAYGEHEIVVSPLLEKKLIGSLTTQDKLLCQSGLMINISSIETVYLTEFYNIVVTKGFFYAEKLLVHNLEKAAWTTYLDWIPTKVTYAIPSEICIPCLFVGLCFVIVVMIAVIVLCDDKR